MIMVRIVDSTSGMRDLPDKRPVRVLLVDDHEMLRYGMRDVIDTIDGYTVVAEAYSCQSTLVQIEQVAIDLIFLDLSLPDGDGINLIGQIKRRADPPTIIVLSATLDDDTLLETMLAGASGYLTKDIPAAEIARLLKGFQRGELAMLPLVAARLVKLLVKQYLILETKYDAPGGTLFPSPSQQKRRLQPDHASVPLRASAHNPSPLHLLTPQEEKIFVLMRQGSSNKQIAAQLAISPFTVGKHIQNILRKLGVINRTQAASYTAFEGGFDPNK